MLTIGNTEWDGSLGEEEELALRMVGFLFKGTLSPLQPRARWVSRLVCGAYSDLNVDTESDAAAVGRCVLSSPSLQPTGYKVDMWYWELVVRCRPPCHCCPTRAHER